MWLSAVQTCATGPMPLFASPRMRWSARGAAALQAEVCSKSVVVVLHGANRYTWSSFVGNSFAYQPTGELRSTRAERATWLNGAKECFH